MSFSIGRGKFQQNSILYPANNGIAMVAKNRIQQAVAMENARLTESIKVDGVDLQIWIKNTSGQLCSCGCNDLGSSTDDAGNVNHIDAENPFADMTVEENWENWQIDATYNEAQRKYDNREDYQTLNKDIDEELITQYAESSDNSLLYGGDKTPCGICYGTGYKNGYDLFNGKRIVLDYYDTPENRGFVIDRTYPISFKSTYSSSNYLIWKFNAPTFFKKFLGLRVRNNVDLCHNYDLEISFDGQNFQKYSENLIGERKGQKTTVYLRVKPYDLGAGEFSITHIEVFYQLGDYIKGDFAPITNTENFELFEALQTTSLELAGDVAYLDRECVIGEPKNGNLWKITSITPHMDSNRQIFRNELELRMIQKSENLYCLNLINNPYLILNYRGLEQKQNMLTYNGDNNEEYK